MAARAGARRYVSAEARIRLAARQAELIQALHGGPPAEGLNARLVTITSGSLVRKRARGVARVFPALARGLEPDFGEHFAAFARANPPPDCGALADGLAFGRFLRDQRRLPDEARVERMLTSARLKLRSNRLVTRRGPYLGATWAERPRRLVAIVRLPILGTRLFTLGSLAGDERG
jgi:hypothetical protein